MSQTNLDLIYLDTFNFFWLNTLIGNNIFPEENL